MVLLFSKHLPRKEDLVNGFPSIREGVLPHLHFVERMHACVHAQICLVLRAFYGYVALLVVLLQTAINVMCASQCG